jgi:hypothetical protein
MTTPTTTPGITPEMDHILRGLQSQIGLLAEENKNLRAAIPKPKPDPPKTQYAKPYKGTQFSGNNVPSVEEYLAQLSNQIDMQQLTDQAQRSLVLISGLTGDALTWMRQY